MFLLLEVPIDQSMEGFLGWVTGVVGDLLEWVVGVRSSVVDGTGSPPQVMGFASVLMQFLLICGGSGVFPLSMAEKYWPVCGMMRGWRRGCNVGSSHLCFVLAIICV